MSAILANTSAELSSDSSTQVVSLSDCATEANTLHTLIAGYARKSVEYAIRLGGILIRAKASVAHGEWMPWAADNLQFDLRTAERYVAVYENREQIKIESVSNLTEAYRAISNPKLGTDGVPVPRTRTRLTSDTPPTNQEVDTEFYNQWPRLFDGFLDNFPKTQHARVIQLMDMWIQKHLFGPEAIAPVRPRH
jgi:hypothetical protein